MYRHPPTNNQRTVGHFLALGHHDSALLRLSQAFRRRWETMDKALATHAPLSAIAPAFGGSSFWVQLPAHISAKKLEERASASGIVMNAGDNYFADRDGLKTTVVSDSRPYPKNELMKELPNWLALLPGCDVVCALHSRLKTAGTTGVQGSSYTTPTVWLFWVETMIVGVPKEIKNHEYRVGLTPTSVREVVAHGHRCLVETGCGAGIGCDDDLYRQAGAKVLGSAKEIFERSDMIVKVKEPQAQERAMLRDGQILFTYLHLAADAPQTSDLINSGAVCIATRRSPLQAGGLPLLAPMSKVAGRMSIQAGAYCLEQPHGGLGMLLGGVPGVDPAKVVVIGAGVVGTHAAHIAIGQGADTWVIDRNPDVIEAHWRQFGRSTNTVFSTRDSLEKHVIEADLVIGGVLIPGAAAPKLVTADMVKRMKPGAVIVDVAIDQGGCAETSRPTTHADPTYIVDDVVHYCVANMPGGVPRTSTHALNNATLPHVLTLADKGYKQALEDDVHLRNGLNVHAGVLTIKEVAEALNLEYQSASSVL